METVVMNLLPVHIAAGCTAIVAGFLALYARKGAKLHRQSGSVFSCSMVVMCGSAAELATVLKPNGANLLQAALTFYLVTTALLAVRRPATGFSWIDSSAMLVALAVGIAHVTFGFAACRSATGTMYGYPPPLYFMFAPLAFVAVVGDIRMMLRGLDKKHRMARHLWRMCFAMFMATGSFFLGQAKVIPKPMRIFPLLAIPALLPLAILFYWLARVWFGKRTPLAGDGGRSLRPENHRREGLIEPA